MNSLSEGLNFFSQFLIPLPKLFKPRLDRLGELGFDSLSDAPIVTNQVELHPYLNQSRLIAAANAADVAITAYYGMADGRVPREPLLRSIGERYGKSAAQVGLRWLVQQGVIALSKTAKPERVAENAAVFDFALSLEEMAQISGLAVPDGRLVNPPGLAPDWNM